jgi:prephenate dehydratase
MSKRLITLGPRGTFSQTAAKMYVSTQSDTFEIAYRPSISQVFSSLDESMSCCVVPIENLSEGPIPLVLDNIEQHEVSIVWEYLMPIRFSFVSNCKTLPEIRKVYVQFVSRGQCSGFLATLKDVRTITTQSNGESLERMLNGSHPCGAVVAAHSVDARRVNLIIEDVTDRTNNMTRFVALGSNGTRIHWEHESYKTSLLIKDARNCPGTLSAILHSFARRNINLVSIVSRPTGDAFGKYRFYIDIDGHIADPRLTEAVDELARTNAVRWLGSYVKSGYPRT